VEWSGVEWQNAPIRKRSDVPGGGRGWGEVAWENIKGVKLGRNPRKRSKGNRRFKSLILFPTFRSSQPNLAANGIFPS
jgi:hypothetical protein